MLTASSWHLEPGQTIETGIEAFSPRFEIGDLRVDVVEVVDRWFELDYRYFRVKGGNGKFYLLRYKTARDSWELTASKNCFR